MDKINLLGYSQHDLQKLMLEKGEKSYRGNQLFKWLYQTNQYDFIKMTDFSKALRTLLEENYQFKLLEIENKQTSNDGTIKFLFNLEDGQPIETVLIPDFDSDRKTVCISSQVGCALACKFCATGTLGLKRDLSAGEIAGQLLYLRENFGREAFSNIVMMGMGEPLMNFDNLVESIKLMISEIGMGISPKKITVSTSGVSPKIKKLADTGLNVNLAISLHAAMEEKRKLIMPIAETFALPKLIQSVKYYSEKCRTRITFEYIIFRDFNDKKEDVLALTKLLQGISCKVNLLAYNPVEGLDFERPSDEKVDWFGAQLKKRVPAVTIRKSRGRDIDAACGQLAAKNRIRRQMDV